MPKKPVPPTRKPRADAQRNREHILTIAREVFTRRGAEASMDEIARLAAIGPGTLYRHFPTRDALLADVYTIEIEKLGEAQRTCSAQLPPLAALRAWLLVFVDYIATKKIIAPALDRMTGGPSRVYAHSQRVMEEAANTLARNAVLTHDLRPDIDPMDMLRALYGISSLGESIDWQPKARLFVDILLQGSAPSLKLPTNSSQTKPQANSYQLTKRP